MPASIESQRIGPEPPFLRQRPVEDERPPVAPVVPALDLRDAVHEDLEVAGDVRRDLNTRAPATFVECHPSVRRRLLVLATSLAGALALAAVAAASNGGIAPVRPVSPNGQRITDAYWRDPRRHRRGLPDRRGNAARLRDPLPAPRPVPRYEEPEQIHGETRIEIAWTVAPSCSSRSIVAFVFYKLPGIKNTPAASASGGPLNVTVEAHQFYWLFKYPTARGRSTSLTVPVNQVVNLELVGVDVAHSWWVPAFGGKTDAIPGKTNHTLVPGREGRHVPRSCAPSSAASSTRR